MSPFVVGLRSNIHVAIRSICADFVQVETGSRIESRQWDGSDRSVIGYGIKIRIKNVSEIGIGSATKSGTRERNQERNLPRSRPDFESKMGSKSKSRSGSGIAGYR
ncbi:hypothetical protein EVAR_15143_1 [Eumeta japonica]|uniref:Uncharacterized protein n=1 Tax=Eumeta variegata TaxID=151549 RepID=A0A4C1UIH4_EUMVA|nr:hypothetical protein EVAR_15143_1 [Eumeta japonica]